MSYKFSMNIIIAIGTFFVSACSGFNFDGIAIRENLMLPTVYFADEIHEPAVESSSNPVDDCRVVPANDEAVSLSALPTPGSNIIGEFDDYAFLIHPIIGGYYVRLQDDTQGWVSFSSVRLIGCDAIIARMIP